MNVRPALNIKSIIYTLLLSVSLFCISISTASAADKNEFTDKAIEQSILKQYQQVLLDSFDYYSKKFGFSGITPPITIHNFPVLIENNIEYVVQQDYHSELFFSRVHETKVTKSKPSQNIIRISNSPVASGYLSSIFGILKDPFHGSRRMHNGIDIAAKSGSPVSPLGKGTVVFSGNKAGFGNLVEIKHGNTVLTRYAHLKNLLVNVGQKVSIKDKIGLIGKSGRSTGPHLHLEVLFNGKQVDPKIFLANHFDSRGFNRQVAKVDSLPKAEQISEQKVNQVVKPVVKPVVKQLAIQVATQVNKQNTLKKDVAKNKVEEVADNKTFPEVSDYPQISYQDYVKSVDGLFGFTAPDSFPQ